MKTRLVISAVLVLLAAGAAWAIDIQNFPAAIGTQNMTTLYKSTTYASGQFGFAFLADYEADPFVLSFNDNKKLYLVENAITGELQAAVGLFGVIDLGLAARYQSANGRDFDLRVTPAFPDNSAESGAGLGDARIVVKFRLLQNRPGSLGIALVPMASLATGDPDIYAGAGASNVGGALVLDKWVSIADFVVNAGYLFMGRPDGFNPAGQVFGGIGVELAVADWCSLGGEFVGKTLDYGINGIKASAPLEALGSVRFYTPVGLDFLLAGGLGLTSAIGSPRYRITLGMSFTYPRVENGPPHPPPRDMYVDAEGNAHEVVARQPGGVIMLRDLFILPQPLGFDGPQSATLTDQDKAELDQVATIMQQYPRVKIQIEGHVATGVPDAQKLTQDRAEAVLAYLHIRGIEPSRMVAVGMGSDVPVASNNTPEGRARNTRVDILIVEQ